ncbi:MAG: hypothetical protein WD335_01100 [Candidatus Paceibacterota bacterium]
MSNNIEKNDSDDGKWKTVIDFTEINENGICGQEILEVIKKLEK